MSAVPDRPVVVQPRLPWRALQWSVQGLRLWRRAPFTLLAMGLLQMLVEGAMQMIPWVGVTLSKLVVPLLTLGILLGLDELAQGRRLRWSCLLAGLRGPRLAAKLQLAALGGLAVFALQQAFVWALHGWAAVDAVWLGHAAAHRELMTRSFTRELILSGVLPSMLLLPAPCLLLFRGLAPWPAVLAGARMMIAAALPALLFGLLCAAMLTLLLSSAWGFALILVYVPWVTACTYAIWRDLDGAAAT